MLTTVYSVDFGSQRTLALLVSHLPFSLNTWVSRLPTNDLSFHTQNNVFWANAKKGHYPRLLPSTSGISTVGRWKNTLKKTSRKEHRVLSFVNQPHFPTRFWITLGSTASPDFQMSRLLPSFAMNNWSYTLTHVDLCLFKSHRLAELPTESRVEFIPVHSVANKMRNRLPNE